MTDDTSNKKDLTTPEPPKDGNGNPTKPSEGHGHRPPTGKDSKRPEPPKDGKRPEPPAVPLQPFKPCSWRSMFSTTTSWMSPIEAPYSSTAHGMLV